MVLWQSRGVFFVVAVVAVVVAVVVAAVSAVARGIDVTLLA